MALTMDNPLSPSPQTQIKKIVADLQDCVAALKSEFEESGWPLTDDSTHLHRFYAKLEFLLHAGFKGKTSIFGEKKDYWNYFCDCIGSSKDLRDGIKFVKANSELRTSLGRGRAFIRFSLVHQRLADTLQQCVCSDRQTNDWYHARAVWLQPALASTIITCLYDLNDLQFDLSPRGYDLDTAWPTFARKTFGTSPSQHWTPPSRSTSVSSLASIPNLEVPPSPSAHSSRQDPHQVEQLHQELNEAENDRLALQLKVDSLQEGKTMAANQVEDLQKKIDELQKACNEAQVKCETLNNQMNLKEASWLEKESYLKGQVETAEQHLSDLRAQLASTGGTAGLSLAEMSIKLAVQQKQNAALQIDLKTAQMELQNKIQTDAGKTKLIELLDKKVEQLNEQNRTMLAQIEKCADDRQRDAEGNRSSQHLIEVTMDRLKRAEHINGELQKANEALRKMLESMEEKSQKISSLAKEKLNLYKNENSKLQSSVQQLTKQLAAMKAPPSGGDGGAAAGPGKEDEVIITIQKALDESRKDVDLWKSKYDELFAECEKLRSSSAAAAAAAGAGGADEGDRDKMAAGEAAAKLIQLEKERAEMAKALERSREEVKKVLIAKMKVEEEAKMVELRQKEARGKHEEMLKALVLKETEARQLELELTELNAVVEAAEAGAEVTAEDSADSVDRPLVGKLKAILRDRLQLRTGLRTLDVQNISLRKGLETSEKRAEELSKEAMGAQLQVAELKTLVSKTEVESANLGAKIEELEATVKEKVEMEVTWEEERVKMVGELQACMREIADLKNMLEQVSQQSVEEQHGSCQNEAGQNENEAGSSRGEDDRLASQINVLEAKLAEYRERFEHLMKEKVELEGKCRDLESKLKSTKQNLKRAEKENRKLTTERDSLQKERQSLTEEVETLKQTNESLGAQLVELEANITRAFESKVAGLEDDLQKEQMSRGQVETELRQVQSQQEESQTLVSQLQSRVQSDAQEHSEQMKSKQFEVEQYMEEALLLSKKLQTMADEHAKTSAKDGVLCDELRMDLELLQCDLTKATSDLESERLGVQETRQMLLSSCSEQLKGLGTKTEELSLSDIASRIIDDLKTVERNRDEKSTQLDEALQSMEINTANILELEEAAKAFDVEREDYQVRLACAMTENESIKARLETVDSEKEELHVMMNDLKATASSAQASWDAERDQLQKEILLLNQKQEESQALFQQEKLDWERLQASSQQDEAEKLQTTEKIQLLEQKLREKAAKEATLIETLKKQQADSSIVKEGLKQELSALRFELSSQQMEHQQALQGLEGHASSISDLVTKLAAQGSLIEMLEKELDGLKHDRMLEKTRTMNELEELRTSLTGRNEECQLLNSELKRTSLLLDEERNFSLKVKNELTDVRTRYEKELQKSREEVDILQKDTEVLKQQLVKIIRDKDVLWQRTDKLEYLQKLTVAGSWMDDTDVTQCLGCQATFSFLVRKHHCRLCGRIFCYNCCSQWVMTPHSSKKTRICNDCAQYHKAEHDQSFTESKDDSIIDSESDTQSLRKAEANKQGKDDSIIDSESDTQSLRKAEANKQGNGEAAMTPSRVRESEEPTDEEEADQAPSSFLPEQDTDDGIGFSGSPAVDAVLTTTRNDGVLDMAAASSKDKPEYSDGKTKETKSRKSENQSENDGDDDPYDVITPEEVVQSLHESIVERDPHTLSAAMLTADLIAEGCGQSEPDLFIRAGKMYLVPVFIEAPGIVLCWEFSTEPKGIHFSVTFRQDALTSNDLADVLIPLCPCNSHRQAIQGELIAVQPGLYTLVFDNSSSRFTSKKLKYHLTVKKPEAAD